jgi:hypothetical protein
MYVQNSREENSPRCFVWLNRCAGSVDLVGIYTISLVIVESIRMQYLQQQESGGGGG